MRYYRLAGISLLAIVSICSFNLFGAAKADALQSPLSQVADCLQPNTLLDFLPWYACLPGATTTNPPRPRIDQLSDVWLIAFPVTEDLIKAAGYLAVAFIIWGGIQYVRSNGNVSETGAAQSTIINAVIGLVICISSVVMVQFVSGIFTDQPHVTNDVTSLGLPHVNADATTLADILKAVFTVIGGLSILTILLAAYKYVSSNGDQAAIKQAKSAIQYAVVGILVAVVAFTVVQFTLGKVVNG